MSGLAMAVGGGALLIAGVLYWYARRLGDCDAVIDVAKARDFAIRVEGDAVVVSCLVPLVNRGRQDGMVVELLCETSHPGSAHGRPKIVPFCCPENVVEEDDRSDWRARLLHRGETVTLRLGASLLFKKRAPSDDVLRLVAGLPGLTVRVHSKTVGRRSITWRLSELAFPLERLAKQAV